MIKKILLTLSLVCALATVSYAETKANETKSANFDWKTLVGPDLVDATGKKVELSTLDGKYVGIYCSASWCPPCRRFTPELVKFVNANKDKFAIVFYSADRSAADMKKYMRDDKMPWAALPFQSKNLSDDVKKELSGGIPALVIFNPQGSPIDKIVGYSPDWKDRVANLIKK